MKQRFREKVVWITGGGTGIGRALALALSAEGAIVAVSGRRSERLDEVVQEIESAGGRALAVPCDVTDEEAVAAAVGRVIDHFWKLDIAIANAGFGVAGRVERLSAADWRRQFDVNVVGAAMTAKHTIPELRKTEGRLVLMGSVAGFVAMPKLGPYHASKYAVRALGQTLAMELHGTGISCTTLHPGFVESEIGHVNNEGVLDPNTRDLRPAALMWKTEDAARVMVNAIHRRKREVVITGHGKVGAFFGRHAPGLVHQVLSRASGRKKS